MNFCRFYNKVDIFYERILNYIDPNEFTLDKKPVKEINIVKGITED